MLDIVKQYFEDWFDACEYAHECAPDLTFLHNGEPFTALLFIFLLCYVAWAVNEARIKPPPAKPPRGLYAGGRAFERIQRSQP